MAELLTTTVNNSLQLPTGTTAERPPSPEDGYIRFNTDTDNVEYYVDGGWFSPPKYRPGLLFSWYDTQGLYDSVGHPANDSELDDFFNSFLSGVNFGDNGPWFGQINWGDGNQTGGGGLTGQKPSGVPSGGFAWQVQGYIYAPETGVYTFGVDSDDASDVFVNNSRVAFWYDGHGFSGSFSSGSGQNTGTISLTAGEYYPFRARFEEGGGGDGIQVGWQRPSESSITLIPGIYFFRE